MCFANIDIGEIHIPGSTVEKGSMTTSIVVEGRPLPRVLLQSLS